MPVAIVELDAPVSTAVPLTEPPLVAECIVADEGSFEAFTAEPVAPVFLEMSIVELIAAEPVTPVFLEVSIVELIAAEPVTPVFLAVSIVKLIAAVSALVFLAASLAVVLVFIMPLAATVEFAMLKMLVGVCNGTVVLHDWLMENAVFAAVDSG
jgi:hypothetical protein